VNLQGLIREIPDFPKTGISFKDITPLLENAEAFKSAIDSLSAPYLDKEIDRVVGIDARGFLLAAPVAYRLSAGLSIVRKKGKLPSQTISADYSLEYAENVIEMHNDTIKRGERVVLVDDVLATGGTAAAAIKLINQLGGNLLGASFLIQLDYLNGKSKLDGVQTCSLINYFSE